MLHFSDGTALVLKQADPATAKAVGTATGNEETMLGLMPEAGIPDFARAAIPRLVGVDPGTGTVIMEGKTGFTSMREIAKESLDIPVPVLAALASVTAGIHATPVGHIIENEKYASQRIAFPFASFVTLTPSELASGPGMDYSDYAAAMQSVDESVARLRDAWGPKGLMHFDLREDNILFKNPGGERPEVALIDWELAGFGDQMLDVGTIVGQLLIQWLHTLRGSVGSLASSDAWATARRNVGLFLAAYGHSAPFDPDQRETAFRYAGLSLLMYAAGRLEQIGSLGRIGHLCLFVGCKLLNNPQGLAKLLVPGARKAGG